ncbi:30S ribosomal protein S15 [Candidatus Woesearchaeota archaeon]|nr:30S ribosomal protein S15 [Candidatus Woesearchaeota archaeon]
MARMHSRRKGKSGSKKPAAKIPVWSPLKDKEVEKLVIKFAKTGKSASEIGLLLRDAYGIPSVKTLTQKRITTIFKENDLLKSLPEDLLALIKRLIKVRQHVVKNKHDTSASRGVILTNSKIRRLTKYYKNTGVLPADWQLDMDRLKMYLE